MRIAIRRVLTIAACLGLGIGVVSVSAADITGTWALDVDLGAAGGGTATFVLKQEPCQQAVCEADLITGTYEGAVGSADVTGSITGDQVKFSFEVDQVGMVSFEGTVSGNTMKGDCDYGVVGAGTFEGKKE